MRTFIANSYFRGIITAGWLILTAGTSMAGATDGAKQLADAQVYNSIESLDYASMPGGKVVVKVTLKEESKQPPASFMTKSPIRVIVDFPNTSSHLSKNLVAVSDTSLRSMNVAQAGNRTRLVLNLNKPVNYSSTVEGKTVVIALQELDSASTHETVVTHFSQPTTTSTAGALMGVDFQRGKNGEGRIIADLGKPGTGIDIHQQGKNLIIDFLNTTLSDKLERRLNVTDFATPVLTVDTFKQANNTRMVIEPKGDWEHVAYQTDQSLVVVIRPSTGAVDPLNKKYSGEKLSFDFNNIDINSLLNIIRDFTNKNVIIDDSVKGNLSLHLKDVPWDEALEIITLQKDLVMKELPNNTLLFESKAKAKERSAEALQAKEYASQKEPIITDSVVIKYLLPSKVAEIIKGLNTSASGKETTITDAAVVSTQISGGILSKLGSVVPDDGSGTLFVKDTRANIDAVKRLVASIDIPKRQVLIQARLVAASDNFSKGLGARFGVQKKTSTVGIAHTIETSNKLAQGNSPSSPDLNVNLPASPNISSLALSLFKLPAGFMLDLELSAGEADTKSKTLSSPSVLTAHAQAASFSFGQTTYVQTIDKNGSPSSTQVDATMTLNVTPTITPDDKIDLDVTVSDKTIDGYAPGTNTPIIGVKSVKTKALVANGETAVLGGFISRAESNVVNKVPFFGDLPIFGIFFRNTNLADTKKELLFFITPKIQSDALRMN